MCPASGEPRIVLLTPGPYNETYFEHAYLARYLGLTLVEGSDLTVRDQHLFLKTMHGLEPVHGILKRLDDEFLDPLELRPNSHLGVPGLLQAIRAGNVLVANAPGSGFLESTALLGFLPALARHLLGEELQLPSLASWWCGERAALEAVLPQLARGVIKPTYGGAGAGAVLGKSLSRRELDEWAGRIVREAGEHTVQAWLPLSQMPTWKQSAPGPSHRAALADAAGIRGVRRPAVLAGVARRPDAHRRRRTGDRLDAARRQQRRHLGSDRRRGRHHQPAAPRPAGRGNRPPQPQRDQSRRRKPVLAGPLHRAHRKHRPAGAAGAGEPERRRPELAAAAGLAERGLGGQRAGAAGRAAGDAIAAGVRALADRGPGRHPGRPRRGLQPQARWARQRPPCASGCRRNSGT